MIEDRDRHGGREHSRRQRDLHRVGDIVEDREIGKAAEDTAEDRKIGTAVEDALEN